MAGMTPSDVHLNKFLSDFMLGYRPGGFIGENVFPIVSVAKQTDNYATMPKGAWFRQDETLRAPRQRPNGVSFTVSSDTYVCRNYALSTDVDYETQDNADQPIQPLQQAAMFLRDRLDLDNEIRAYDALASGVGSSQSLTGGDIWSDFANSDPITNLRTARQAVRATTGLRPNLAIIGQKAWDVIQYHPDLVRAANPGAGVGGTVTLDQFSRIAGVDRTLIGETVKNTAAEDATATYTDVWSTQCFLLYTNPNPGIMTATFGVAFDWVGPKIGRGGPGRYNVYQKELDEEGCTRLWSGYYRDRKIVAAELGFRIDTGI